MKSALFAKVGCVGLTAAALAVLNSRVQATDPLAVSPPAIQFVPKHPNGKKPAADDKAEVKLPKWLDKKIADWKAGPATKTQVFPSIYTYKYKGKLVYFIQQGPMPKVYDTDGNVLGVPWGGFTGKGDGRLPDFREKATDRTLVWKDPKAGDKNVKLHILHIKQVEASFGAARALKLLNTYLRRPMSPVAKKLLEAEKKRLEKAK